MAVNSTDTLLVNAGVAKLWANVDENLDDWIEQGQYLIPRLGDNEPIAYRCLESKL
jgi:hypothetical protein